MNLDQAITSLDAQQILESLRSFLLGAYKHVEIKGKSLLLLWRQINIEGVKAGSVNSSMTSSL